MLTEKEYQDLEDAKSTIVTLSVLCEEKEPSRALPRTPEQEAKYQKALKTARRLMLKNGEIIPQAEPAQ